MRSANLLQPSKGRCRGRYDPDHIRKGLLCMLDTDMNAEVVEAVAEAERAGAAEDGD